MATERADWPNRKEDYQVEATIESANGVRLQNVRCRIYLPENNSDSAYIIIQPTVEDQKKVVYQSHWWKFSLWAELSELGMRSLEISANNVYTLSMWTQHWGANVSETVWKAEPTDLKVVYKLESGINHPTDCRFWLTPSFVLTPANMIMKSYTGNIEVEPVETKTYELENGLFLEFKVHYKYQDLENGGFVVARSLVAESNLWDNPVGSQIIDDTLLRKVDDFLLIASLAERGKCVCVGWEVYDSVGQTRFFRGDVSVPKTKEEHNHNDDLIPSLDYEEFIKTTYPRFVRDTHIDLVRDAIRSALPRDGFTVETRFINLFSAIETLVLSFRKANEMEFVFTDSNERERWQEITGKSLRTWLKEQPLLQGKQRAQQRKLIYDNLPALDRISFSHAFNEFCEHYLVDLSDLWNMVGNDDSNWSLTTIRNKLVHGEVLPSYKNNALFAGMLHLQWTLERLILAYLGWDVDRSNVCKAYLSSIMNAHKEMEVSRKMISQ